jgi:hypothetical protein
VNISILAKENECPQISDLKNNPEKVSSPFSNDSIRDWP